MTETDYLQRILFRDVAARCVFVRLERVIAEVSDRNEQAPALGRRLLNEALLLVGMMSSGLKFAGRISLQIRSDSGPLRMLVADCTDQGGLRGTVTCADEFALPDDDEAALIANLREHAVLTLTLDPSDGGQRWQGIVPFEGSTLADAVSGYFERSEQLATHFRLATDGGQAAALMLQRMPGDGRDAAAWDYLQQLLDTVKDEELLSLSSEQLLRRLFHEQSRQQYPARALSFHCPCSRERVADMLLSLGPTEMEDMIGQGEPVEVRCQFCNALYRFETEDLAMLDATLDASTSRSLH
ncbi:MAG: Hsp33 family molecular chaperone HslO [Wenzhouxiangella sp.]